MDRFDGRIGVSAAPELSLSWGELAAAAVDPSSLPHGTEAGLRAQADFEMEDSTYPFGAHVAVVEVDTETGKVKLIRHVAVDDCGRRINPMLVEGQIHGGIAQGAAQALFESFVYDEAGNPQTSSLATFEMPMSPDRVWRAIRDASRCGPGDRETGGWHGTAGSERPDSGDRHADAER